MNSPEGVLECNVPCRCLTPESGHWFFGYYDTPAYSGDGRHHLCHRVGFWDRIPTPADAATLGMIRLADRKFVPLAETTAWNFQQGAMLQWLPQSPNDEIIFNQFLDGGFMGVVRNVKTGGERHLSRPVSNVDPTGRYALSINFARLFAFRPGYGYPHLPDPWADTPQPVDDGVWLVDMATGRSELILSLRAIADMDPSATAQRKILVNHITFSPDGSRFVFLPRTFPTAETPDWKTAIYTSDLRGNCFALRPYAYASHYNWRDSSHIAFHSGTPRDKALRVLRDLSADEEIVDAEFFRADGHCNYSPDRQWLLYDSYASEGRRRLYLYDLRRRRGMTLAQFRSGKHDWRDYRADLHPRWNRTGTAISVDSTHEECRRIYELDLRGIVASTP